MSWIVALCALQAPVDVVEPQDPDRPAYAVSDLKALREANIFSPHKKSSERTSSSRREEPRRETKAEPVRPKGLQVTGFIVDPETKTPRAILEDRNDEKHRILKEPLFAKPGDEAQGWKVDEVAVDQVTIVKDEERKVLRLGESFPEPAGVPALEGAAPTAPAAEKAETKPLEEGEKNDVLERLKLKNKKKRSSGSDEP